MWCFWTRFGAIRWRKFMSEHRLWNSSTATAVRQPASETLWDQTRPFWNVLASLQWPKPTVQLTRPHLSRGEDVLVDDAIGDKGWETRIDIRDPRWRPLFNSMDYRIDSVRIWKNQMWKKYGKNQIIWRNNVMFRNKCSHSARTPIGEPQQHRPFPRNIPETKRALSVSVVNAGVLLPGAATRMPNSSRQLLRCSNPAINSSRVMKSRWLFSQISMLRSQRRKQD